MLACLHHCHLPTSSGKPATCLQEMLAGSLLLLKLPFFSPSRSVCHVVYTCDSISDTESIKYCKVRHGNVLLLLFDNCRCDPAGAIVH